jgi:carboxyl-terminal processing protease
MLRVLLTAFVLVAVLFAGMWIGGHSGLLPSELQKLVADDDIATIDAAVRRIHDDYYRPVDKSKLSDDAVRGAVRGLDDRFSSYFDPKDYTRFKEAANSEFSGIGVLITQVDDGLRINQVYPKSPARKAGLRKGDVIVAAQGQRLRDKPDDAATSLIKGKEGTDVTLGVRRGKRELKKVVRREKIEVPVVTSKRRKADGKTYAVVRLEQFSPGAHAELYAALKKVDRDKVDGLVLDLRGNPGGRVTEARLVASAFLTDGEIVTTKGRTVATRVYNATGNPVLPKLPMVVLVDKASASASEIVAGALQDRDRAKLVGQKTYGKGVFQELVQLGNGGALTLTAGQFFLPSGRNLGGKGVARGSGLKPEVRAVDDPKTRKRDEGLARAVEVLSGS